jgi:hypothetical protein
MSNPENTRTDRNDIAIGDSASNNAQCNDNANINKSAAHGNISFPPVPTNDAHMRNTRHPTTTIEPSNKRRRTIQNEYQRNPNDNKDDSQARRPPSQAQPSIESILARNMPQTLPPPPSLFDIAHNLDFGIRPRPTRDGTGTIDINEKNGLKITADMKYLMMLYAIEMGYSLTQPNYANTYDKNIDENAISSSKSLKRNQAKYSKESALTNSGPSAQAMMKNKKLVHEAACQIVCYDYGLLRPIGSTTLHKAFETFRKNKYIHTANLFETRHQDRGRTSYVQKIEENHPGHLKSLFLYAKEKANEYTKYDDYRKIMMERSQKVKPDLNLKLSMNDLMNFFDKNPKLKPRGMPKRKKPIRVNMGAELEEYDTPVGNNQFMEINTGDTCSTVRASDGRNIGAGDGLLNVMGLANNEGGITINPGIAVNQRQMQILPMDGMNMNLIPLHLTNPSRSVKYGHNLNEGVSVNVSGVGDDANSNFNEVMGTDNLDNTNGGMGINVLPNTSPTRKKFARTLNSGSGANNRLSSFMGSLTYPGEGGLGNRNNA